MDTPIGHQSGADVRDYLAEERTFLAWIRTAIALMAFGFVVARFGLFLQEMQITDGAAAVRRLGLSPSIGTVFIAAGVVVSLLSVRRHLRVIGELKSGQFARRGPSQEAIILALFLASLGMAMAVYLGMAHTAGY